jgi:hypothetical protein
LEEQGGCELGSGRAMPPEVRWFADGSLPWQPAFDPRRRTDVYDGAALGPDRSVKRRGLDGPVELKWRAGRVELVEVAGLEGFAERWFKRRLATDGRRWRPSGPPRVVTKTTWTLGGVDVTEVLMDGHVCWTVAVRPAVETDWALLDGLWSHLGAAVSRSYPAWLLERRPVAARRVG